MSTEKTADLFKNKSEEEIMNWMIRYMTPEQIKSCFEGSGPSGPSGPGGPSGPSGPSGPVVQNLPNESQKLEDLRRFCSKKRYVIHKIVKDKVYFWYYEGSRWKYYNKPFEHFVPDDNGLLRECGKEEEIDEDMLDNLKEAYFNNNVNDEEDSFRQVKQEYKSLNLNEEWEEREDTLLTALNIQKGVQVSDEYKKLFSFAPVLIEDATSTNVNYYYLVNIDGEVKFIEGNLPISKFREDLIEILDDLNLQISGGAGSGASTSKKLDEWKQAIRIAADNIYSKDLDRIKKHYNTFPLSKDSPFFMKDLFGNSFGSDCSSKKPDLNNYILNNFGEYTASKFGAKLLTNEFGVSTVALVPK